MSKLLYEFSSQLDKRNIATCKCYEDKIVLTTEGGGFWVRYYSDKTRTILIRDIASVIMSEGMDTRWTTKDIRVYIQFITKGATEKTIEQLMNMNEMSHVFDHASEFIDNGLVYVSHKERASVLPIMKKIKEYVENYTSIIAHAEYKQSCKQQSPSANANSNDPYAKIVQYKQLLDQGIITEEEFAAAKRIVLHMD